MGFLLHRRVHFHPCCWSLIIIHAIARPRRRHFNRSVCICIPLAINRKTGDSTPPIGDDGVSRGVIWHHRAGESFGPSSSQRPGDFP